LLVGEVRSALGEALREIAGRRNWDIIALEIMPDHVHCFVGAPPGVSVSTLARTLKGVSSTLLRRRFRHLRQRPVLWSPSYFAGSAGNVSSETVERYIAEQRSR
jgi:putative transposase